MVNVSVLPLLPLSHAFTVKMCPASPLRRPCPPKLTQLSPCGGSKKSIDVRTRPTLPLLLSQVSCPPGELSTSKWNLPLPPFTGIEPSPDSLATCCVPGGGGGGGCTLAPAQ